MPQTRRAVIIILLLFLYTGVGRALALPLMPNGGAEHPEKDTSVHGSGDSLQMPKVTPPSKGAFVLKPIIGLGTGMFSFFGNVKAMNGKVQNPMTSRIGYDLTYAQKLGPVTEFDLYALFGKLSVNERSTTLNWNFLSEIRGGGAHLLFKILPNQPVTPYVLTGVESFEYLTKTDLYDQYGNKYYYWSDGSIRNLPQNAPNASSATVIYRNYSFESDMREMNINNTGKYSLQTFAIPLGVGFMFHIGKRADFLIGTTLHYTFTNHIDGYGDSIHSKRNDMFLMSSVSLRFDLTGKKHYDTTSGGYLPEDLEGVDYEALMNGDYDHDGVRDWDDSCAGTPKGVPVDSKGCPLDGDHDGVPDYRDKQLNTPPGAIVDDNGVALTDSAIKMQYLMFMDSTGQFAQVEIQNTIGAPVATASNNKHYTIQLGRYTQGVPPNVMDKLLSVPDVQFATMPDSSTVYTVGDYTDYSVAKARQEQLVKEGLPDAKIVYKKGKTYVEATPPVKEGNQGTKPANGNNAANNNVVNNNLPNNNVPNNVNNPSNNNVNPNVNNSQGNKASQQSTIVYRVQLGAYSHKLSRDIFANINDLVEVKTENGFYTYSAGSFTNYQEAVNFKTQLITQGFPDAFIKAYKDGKRIPLKDAGATFIGSSQEDMSEKVTKENNTLDKADIRFKVQIGVFKGAPPKNFMERIKTMPDVTTNVDASGQTHYVVGSYTSFDAAKKMRDKLAAAPALKGAFIVAYFKDKAIPLSQAISIMKQ